MLRIASGSIEEPELPRIDETAAYCLATDTSVVADTQGILLPQKHRELSIVLTYPVPGIRENVRVLLSFGRAHVSDTILDLPEERRHVFAGVGQEMFPINRMGIEGVMRISQMHKMSLRDLFGANVPDAETTLLIGQLEQGSRLRFACAQCGETIEKGEAFVIGSEVRVTHAPIHGGLPHSSAA
ncbi:MAG: hypothetical protein ABL949_17130 [Fimbriimonadaceae bacterium]